MSILRRILNAVGPRSEPVRVPLLEEDTKCLRWVSVDLPEEQATSHFLAVGTTGSGKTSVLRLLMQDALPTVGSGDCRAVVYDAKQDAIPMLSAFVPKDRIVIMNPFDARGARWDMMDDLDEPRLILEAVTTLFPRTQDSTQFFYEAAVSITYHVLLSWYLSGFRYQFSDLMHVLKRPSLIKQVLRMHEQTSPIVGQFLADRKLRQNVMASIAVRLLPYDHVAACWDHAVSSFSMKQWAEGEYVLVLGNAEVSRFVVDSINRFLLKSCINRTLNKTESRTTSDWYFLDEVSEMGKLDGLVSLLKKGRSKGAKACLSIQTISGLRDNALYGQTGTDEILGQVGHKFVGRLECVATADYFSHLIGEQEVWLESSSHTYGSQNSSSTYSYSRQVKKAVLPSEFLSMQPCSIQTGLSGYCLSPHIGVFRTHLAGGKLFNSDLLPLSEEPAFVPRPASCQVLGPWPLEKYTYFAIDPPKPKTARRLSVKKVEPAKITHTNPLDDVFG